MSESIASDVLAVMGATVREIPTSAKEESDWLTSFNDFDVLIEEKTKFENPAATEARKEALEGSEVHGTHASLRPNKGINRIIHKAAKQLRSTGGDVSHHARVLWFNCVGFDREAKQHQALNSLYGATKVFDLDKSASLQDCFFFHNSAFFSHPDIDGAVIAVVDGQDVTLRLCLNPYSDRWQSLRDSPFAAKFPRCFDPIAQEAEGIAMIADCDIDRRNSEAVVQYLREKYRVPMLQQMDMNIATAVISVPRDVA